MIHSLTKSLNPGPCWASVRIHGADFVPTEGGEGNPITRSVQPTIKEQPPAISPAVCPWGEACRPGPYSAARPALAPHGPFPGADRAGRATRPPPERCGRNRCARHGPRPRGGILATPAGAAPGRRRERTGGSLPGPAAAHGGSPRRRALPRLRAERAGGSPAEWVVAAAASGPDAGPFPCAEPAPASRARRPPAGCSARSGLPRWIFRPQRAGWAVWCDSAALDSRSGGPAARDFGG